MALIRTENSLYNRNSSFGETIDKFQDGNIKNKTKKSVRTLGKK